jgi:hypothetical protein
MGEKESADANVSRGKSNRLAEGFLVLRAGGPRQTHSFESYW